MLSNEERSAAERLLRVLRDDNEFAIAVEEATRDGVDVATRALADAIKALDAADAAAKAAKAAREKTQKRVEDMSQAIEEGNRAALGSFDIGTVARADELLAKDLENAHAQRRITRRSAQVDLGIAPVRAPKVEKDVPPRDTSAPANSGRLKRDFSVIPAPRPPLFVPERVTLQALARPPMADLSRFGGTVPKVLIGIRNRRVNAPLSAPVKRKRCGSMDEGAERPDMPPKKRPSPTDL